jgi:hypothetical protein
MENNPENKSPTKTVTITRPATNEEMILMRLTSIDKTLNFFKILVIIAIILEVINFIFSF